MFKALRSQQVCGTSLQPARGSCPAPGVAWEFPGPKKHTGSGERLVVAPSPSDSPAQVLRLPTKYGRHTACRRGLSCPAQPSGHSPDRGVHASLGLRDSQELLGPMVCGAFLDSASVLLDVFPAGLCPHAFSQGRQSLWRSGSN